MSTVEKSHLSDHFRESLYSESGFSASQFDDSKLLKGALIDMQPSVVDFFSIVLFLHSAD